MSGGIKNLILSFFLISINISSNDALSFNTHGITGIHNTPTARLRDEGSIGVNISYQETLNKYSLIATPFDWFEASIFYADLKKIPYGFQFGNTQSFKDKGFNFKVLLKREGDMPAIAIGSFDTGGTGWFSSEYIVASKKIKKFDLSFGIGWGKLSGGKLSFDNPFIEFDESFKNRSKQTSLGGTFNTNYFFSGPDVAPFLSVSYLYSKDINFGFELDSFKLNDFERNIGFTDSNNYISVFLNRNINKRTKLKITYERAEELNISFEFNDNFAQKNNSKTYKEITDNLDNKALQLKKILEKNQIGLVKIEKTENKDYFVTTRHTSYVDVTNADNNTIKAFKDSGLENPKNLVIIREALGMEVSQVIYPLRKGRATEESDLSQKEVIYNVVEKYPYTHFYQGVNLSTFLGAREGFLYYGLMYNLGFEGVLRKNFLFTVDADHALISNFDGLYIPPLNTFPNQVRSDIKKYLNEKDNGININRLQFDYYYKYRKNNYFAFSGGILEEMFSGIGFEYLNKKPLRKYLSWGAEAYQVFKRDYKNNFGLKGYKQNIWKLNLYLTEPQNNIILKGAYGTFLAGDKGIKIDISKRFKNGTSMGIFFTKTDVSSIDFGEGSFDKGVYFTIPLDADKFYNFFWRPLTKDPGATLNKKLTLFEYLEKY